jgi:catechol 2,3-dioxygenase-like lactoylglutathione lyase family enzyme
MEVVGIHHVNIQVRDLDEARAFYEGVLGLRVLERPPFPTPGVWYALGGQQLHLGVADAHVGPVRQHFAIHVPDLEAAVSSIEARGGTGLVQRAVGHYPGAGRQANVRDPSGNLIELNEPD